MWDGSVSKATAAQVWGTVFESVESTQTQIQWSDMYLWHQRFYSRIRGRDRRVSRNRPEKPNLISDKVEGGNLHWVLSSELRTRAVGVCAHPAPSPPASPFLTLPECLQKLFRSNTVGFSWKNWSPEERKARSSFRSEVSPSPVSFHEGRTYRVTAYLLKKKNPIFLHFLQLRCVEDLQTIQVIKILRYEKKVAKMCFLMAFVFLTCWMPYIVTRFLVVNGYGHLITPTVSIVAYLFAKSSTVYNPVIYIFMIRKVSSGMDLLSPRGTNINKFYGLERWLSS